MGVGHAGMYMQFDKVVVGGGLFGTFAALVLARRGFSVAIVERDQKLMQRATLVNQARLHSGLHYPRSLLTARTSLQHYDTFKSEFPSTVREDFKQIYAVSSSHSRTSAGAFDRFVGRLGIDVNRVDPDRFFIPGSIDSAMEVTEASFDAVELSRVLQERVAQEPAITVLTERSVVGGSVAAEHVDLQLDDGRQIHSSGVILAAYAGLNPLRASLGLKLLPLKHELTEVVLCSVGDPYRGIGITVMDGPFWSFMPFGLSDLVSVTSVSLTPVRVAPDRPSFACQLSKNVYCSPDRLAQCTSCPAHPPSLWSHYQRHLGRMLRDVTPFTYRKSMWTVKTVLASTEVDDARPTFVAREIDCPVWTVFSGKVSTVLDLEDELK